MDEGEVIELGEDGCFELPANSLGATGVVNSLGSKEEIVDDNIIKPISIKSLFQNLQDNQYRIYKTADTGLVIIIKIISGIKYIRAGSKLLIIETLNNTQQELLKIPLPFNIQANSEDIECKYFESYTVITLKLA